MCVFFNSKLIKIPLALTHAEKYALSFDLSHDVVAILVLEKFHKT